MAKLVACVESLAHTSVGLPKMPMARSTRWMPVADSGPTGASTADSRQLSGGRSRNLSWLKLPSKTSGVPSFPSMMARRSSTTAGSKRRSCPMPSCKARGGDRVDGALGVVAGSAQRLLAEHVFAVRRRGDDLFGVEFVWRAKDHGVDGVVGQHRVDVGIDVVERTGEVGCRRRAAPTASRASGSTSTPATICTYSLPSRSPTILRPHHPSPTTAALITATVNCGRSGDALSADVNFAPVCVAIRECLPPNADVQLTYQRQLREIGHESGLRAHR